MQLQKVRRMGAVGIAVGLISVLPACSEQSAKGDNGEPEDVEVVVSTGPGGGADVFSREVIAMMEEGGEIDRGAWTVSNRDGGNSAVAASYLSEKEGQDNAVAFVSNVWLVNRLVTEGVATDTLDFTPIMSLMKDSLVVVVPGDSELEDLDDLVEAAEETDGDLVQAGGSLNSIDELAGQTLMKDAGVSWRYLPFPDGGDRKTALLRGDAQLYITEPGDIQAEVEAGDAKVIGVIGEERTPAFPDVPSAVEQGYTAPAPVQTRGVVGPAGMPDEAVDYYVELLSGLVDSVEFKDYVERVGATPFTVTTDEYRTYLTDQQAQHVELFRDAERLVNE